MKLRAHKIRFAVSALALIFVVAAFFGAVPAFAQSDITSSLDSVAEDTGLGTEDPRIIVAKLINTGLTVLGVIVVVIIIYGGFVWMTAGGTPERVDKAKKILLNAIIGLAIILASWGITTFVIGSLLGAVSDSSGGGGDGGGGGGFGSGSSAATFAVSDYSPEGEVSIRNIVLRVTFSQNVDETTVDGNVTVKNAATGNAVDGTLAAVNNKVTFTPTAACPEPNTDRFCFDENTTFTVTVGSGIDSTSGKSLSCTASAGCSSTFTSGSLVDTESPTAEFTYPDDGDSVPSASTTTLQVAASDDTQISGADFALDGTTFTTISAADDAGTSVVLETVWDTADLENGKRYRLTASVTDIAGNTADDAITVRARPATCFNGALDEDAGETDVDCGGDTASAAYCGACDGSSCTEDADCSSGSCENGVCAENPEISSISPGSGAVGTYVTVSGSGFGASEGEVTFTSEIGATVAANVLACGDGDGWSDSEIIAAVPEGAGDGAITVTTSTGASDSTDDEDGELIAAFDVNDTARPGLCTLSDDSGTAGAALALSGVNFGSSQGESTVLFDDTEAGSYSSWSSSAVAVTVPTASSGEYEVLLEVDGNASNALAYTIVDDDDGIAPTVSELSPSEGGVGQYVTVSGSNFGDSVGTVLFTSNETGETAYGSVAFPDACSDDFWSDDEIIIIVPDEFTSGSGVEAGEYTLLVRDASGDESNETTFTVTDADPTPGLCALDPESGDEGDTITLYGDNFGSSGSVTFYSDVAGAASAWDDEELTVAVPAGATSGPVTVTSGGEESNDVTFAVGEGTSATAATASAAYAWSFSTGEIPETPEVVEECSDDTVSAVPNSRFTDDGDVCVNAVVYAEFTTLMNEASVEDAVTVELCAGEGDSPCDDVTEVAGTAAASSSESATTFTWTPTADFSVSSTYRVTVDTGARSADDIALDNDVTWQFSTSDSTDACVIERVVVSPSVETLTEVNATANFGAQPVTGCVVTDAADYTWDWSLDAYSYADFSSADAECVGDPSNCASVEALAEGEVVVSAAPSGYAVTGEASLVVNFSDPYVIDYQPNCTEACVNATVGATFNTAMDGDTIASQDMVGLYRCENEICSDVTLVESAVPSCVYDEGDADACVGFSFGDVTLSASTFYRVIISGSVTSTSGVGLIRTNYGTDYSWTFRVREDESLCAVERIALSPDDVSVASVGDQAAFSASAYGEADSCSTSGQELSSADFDWGWTNPIADNPDNDASYRVAAWYADGEVDADVTSIPSGCTSLCLASGSEPDQAVCGNSELEIDATTQAGEECDDGNDDSGDGCSSSCKNEGSQTTCGNGSIDDDEDCDDSNTTDDDGCSSTCTAEGSRSVGATCGNGDIAYDAVTYAGEECDDGNATNGDGCSRECLREGSSTEAMIGSALCGDGETTEPYETCDDGNGEDGDGCSSNCLREGAYVDATDGASVCGNGEVEYDANTLAGEACDPGADGEGCGNDCLWKGSSTSFATPSYCGDGTAGTGELVACESGASGDGFEGGREVAQITDDASYEVSTETNLASAEIEVTESSSSLSTTASLTLSCVAQSDQDCSDPETQGAGDANCCFDRPTVSLYPTGAEVCRNALLYGEFSERMDVSSFTSTSAAGESVRMYARLSLGSGEDCPATHTSLSRAPSSLALRAWNAVRRFLFGASASADSGDCIVPVTAYGQTTNADETFTVTLGYDEMLEADATYTLVVEGDDDVTDETTDGVTSAHGAGMNGTATQSFTTGSEVCTLDALAVADSDTDSPYTFTTSGEAHDFTVTALSYASGSSQEIEPITGAYDWEYGDWSVADETLFTAAAGSGSGTGTVTAAGENGNTSVAITATMVDDDYFGTACDSGDADCEPYAVSGTAKVEAYLCENPWPAVAAYPWSDDLTGAANGLAERGVGFMHVATGYCRDAGEEGESDDLPTVTVVRPPASNANNVIKEYFFEVDDDSGDAIGIRIVSNGDFLSPAAWYEAQGFVGNPTSTTIDGFPAVQDGRTVYISAPNAPGLGIMYANMFAVSYNEGASEDTLAMYDMVVESLAFAINVDDDRLCYASGALVTDSDGNTVACSSDLDCDVESGQECGSVKLKLMRDITRLGDVKDVGRAIDAYGDENGACSDTTAQSCTEDSECPDGETCNPLVPTLPSGTFVASLASSAWESWGTMLGGALGEDLPVDPLNDYSSCGDDATAFAAFNATSCVNETTGAYACPEDSYAYHYRAVGSDGFELYAALEYGSETWFGDYDDDATDAYDYFAAESGSGDSFCDGDTYGASTLCGDGVVGSGETCEIGDTGSASACDLDETDDSDGNGDATDDEDGVVNQICNSTCTGYEASATATCTATSCGNGVVDGSEECDDGAQNGRYGYCGTDCSYASGSYCGDGEVSGSESCDCGNAALQTLAGDGDATATATLAAARPYGGASGSCAGINGEYNMNPNTTCSWDCTAAAAYCGDASVDDTEGETCDGAAETLDSALCTLGYGTWEVFNSSFTPCDSDSDCESGEVCGDGDTTSVDEFVDACPTTEVCIDGPSTVIGLPCDLTAYDCSSSATAGDGVCSSIAYPTSRTRACEDDGSSGDTCELAGSWWYGIDCFASGSCGDGTTDENEECDDGNDTSTDACTGECTENVCGDGYLLEGSEECDEGTANGEGCDASYGSSCSACSTSCRYIASSGDFCGDGETNGDEYCDGDDVPYVYLNATADTPIYATCSTLGATVTADSTIYTCTDAGLCDGGYDTTDGETTSTNGDYCEDSGDCGTGGDCVFPSCATDCASSCPFDTDSAELTVTSNEPGATAEIEATLYSYSSDSTSNIPNAATVTVPSCSAAQNIVADVNYDVTLPDVYLIFVTDTSGSMNATLGSSTRMEVAKDLLTEAVDELYEELGSKMNIALMSFASSVTTDSGFVGEDDESTLLTAIDGYSYGGGTHTYDALDEAKALLDAESDTSNVRKIVVLLSDGSPTGTDGSSKTTSAAYDLMYGTDYELYSVALTTSDSLVEYMNRWSSNTSLTSSSTGTEHDYNQDNLIDYSYSGSTADELEDAYQSIIDSITQGTAVFLTTSGGTTYTSRATLPEGSNVSLPWPAGFSCDDESETDVPLQVTFSGEGTVTLSNLRVDYCAP